MVTALSERKERLMGVEAGANDFLNKPVDMQDLSLRVANATRTKRLFDELEAEKQKSDRLLLNILPKSIAERMKNGEVSIADDFGEVTVVLADLVGFTRLTSYISPEQIVCMLNEIFSGFDRLAEKYELEKIKTVGDAYLVVGGMPHPRLDHAEMAAAFALEILNEINHFNSTYNTSIQIRVGMASGHVIAGVIGLTKFAYDIWGETVNTACHLESMAKPGSIQVSERTYELLRPRFSFSEKQMVSFKGSNAIATYELQQRFQKNRES
jgi:class 3 adenylate cyclase